MSFVLGDENLLTSPTCFNHFKLKVRLASTIYLRKTRFSDKMWYECYGASCAPEISYFSYHRSVFSYFVSFPIDEKVC